MLHRFCSVLSILLAALAAALAPARAEQPPAVAQDVRLGGDAARTRFVMDLDRAVPIRVFALAEPYRIVVDLPDVRFALPPEHATQSRGLISAYRYGLFAPGKARIVIDVTAPVTVDKSFVLDPIDDQPARLVIDLVKVDRATFLKSVGAANDAPPPPAVAVSTDEPDRPVVVLDPGHGGIDPGASTAGVSEKEIVLAFAQRVKEKLEAAGRYRVVTTRSADSFVALGERVQVARRSNADLFLSVHADTLSDPFGVRGATVYTLSDTASDEQAARLAEKENRADLIAGLDLTEEPEEVAGILLDLARRETRTFAMQFARTLVGELKPVLTLNKNAMRSAGFRVLKAPDVPSILLELGYLSSPEDVKLMTSSAWRERGTDAVVDAVGAFFGSRVAGTPTVRLN